MVQEYIEGQTLDEYIRKVTGPISSKRSLAIMKDVVSAINYAHNKRIALAGYDGVLHLDIKPGNVLISKSSNVKIIDYGISQGNNQERGNKIMGSPMYMAPEQLDIIRDLDNRTDIYALGILLHQMITASMPYSKNSTQEELIDDINYSPLIRTQELYPGADQRVQIIIDKATEKDPDERYQSCDEMLEAIEELEEI